MELAWKAIEAPHERLRNRLTRAFCGLAVYGTLCRPEMPRSRSFAR